MQYKISSAMASFCKRTDIADAMEQIKTAGYTSLDFPLHLFAVGFDAPLLQENWREWVRELAGLSRRLQLPITQAHAPWVQDIPADFHYEAPWEMYFRCIEACAMLDCRHLIFHPVRQRERVDSLAMRNRIHDWNVRWFHDLTATAERWGVCINLENTFDSHQVQKEGDLPYPYTTAEDMLALVRDIGSAHVSLCLDTGHANLSEQDIPAMIRAFRGNLTTLHLNDNRGKGEKGKEDLHLFPGKGMISWRPVLEALADISYRGVWNFEPIDELPEVQREQRITLLSEARKSWMDLSKTLSKY